MKTADKAKLKKDFENAKGRTVRVDMLLPVKWKKQLAAECRTQIDRKDTKA